MGEQNLPVYEFGPFRLEVAERRLLRGRRPVHMTHKVFNLLTLLVQYHGRLISKDKLLREIWPDSLVEENNLTVSMAALRKALGEKRAEQRYIVTVHKVGYRFGARVKEIGEQK